MTLKLELPEDVQSRLVAQAKARGLSLEEYAARVLRERGDTHDAGGTAPWAEAARRLGTFGKRHGLSLGGGTLRELLDESRP